MFPDISKLVNELQKVHDDLEQLNMWMALLNGFPAETDPRKLPHEKLKMNYKNVVHPGSIRELVEALNKNTESKK